MISRKTSQKEILKKEIVRLGNFFHAEQLFEKARIQDKNIGIATVYRFLKKLVEEGNIHSYSCNRKTIYSTNKKSHSHFTCEQCKKVEHIDVKKIDFLQKEIKGKICHFQINVTGLCEKCNRTNS